MRASFENIAAGNVAQAFSAYRLQVPGFEFNWHYHPEYELTLILKGAGKRMVGDSYESFREGDLVLIGPNLPHTWASEKIKKKDAMQEAIVVQFSPSIFSGFHVYPEFTGIRKILEQSAHGLSFQLSAGIRRNMEILPLKKTADRIALLIRILDQLAVEKFSVLSAGNYGALKGVKNEKRISQLSNYVQANFSKPITLANAARIVHLSPGAFCKFAKKAFGKTFSDHVNDIRVSHACKLLTETDKPISAIAFAAGFESLTYFNRVFLRKKGMQPNAFRKIN